MRKVEDQQIKSVIVEANTNSNQIMINKDSLPSKGSYYPNDIFARKLNAKEIKQLSTVDQQNVNAVFNKIIGDCLTGVEMRDILINDKIWFIYYLRSITFNDMAMNVRCHCDLCGTDSNQDYVLNKLLVTHPAKDLPEAIKLPNKDTITPGFPTIGTEIQINRLKNDPNVIETVDEEIMTICAHINEINGKKVSLWDAYCYFSVDGCKGSGYDFAYFCQSMKDYVFGAKSFFKTDCSCGEEIYGEISLTPDFFVPKII